jgi:hypothetical protein
MLLRSVACSACPSAGSGVLGDPALVARIGPRPSSPSRRLWLRLLLGSSTGAGDGQDRRAHRTLATASVYRGALRLVSGAGSNIGNDYTTSTPSSASSPFWFVAIIVVASALWGGRCSAGLLIGGSARAASVRHNVGRAVFSFFIVACWPVWRRAPHVAPERGRERGPVGEGHHCGGASLSSGTSSPSWTCCSYAAPVPRCRVIPFWRLIGRHRPRRSVGLTSSLSGTRV